MSKLDAGSAAELARYAVRAGLIAPVATGREAIGAFSAKLTQREIELKLVASGCTGNQIAWQLGIWPRRFRRTVRAFSRRQEAAMRPTLCDTRPARG